MKTTQPRFSRVIANARIIGILIIGSTVLQSELLAASAESSGEAQKAETPTLSQKQASKPKFTVKEETIGTMDAGITADAVVFSPNGRRFAYKRWEGNKPVAVIDGRPEKDFENIYYTTAFAVFSADSRHVAFPAQRGGKWFVVVDGVEGKPCDELKHLAFVPGGSAVAYVARFGEEWCAVVNATEGKRYGYVGKLHFNPDGTHYFFSATLGKTKTVPNPKPEIARFITYIYPSIVVLDGKQTISDGKISQYRDSDEIAFSSDSKHYAYVASLGPPKKLRLVIDGVLSQNSGVAGKEYQDIRYLTFSSDGSRLAYWAITRETTTKECYVVLDGKEGEPKEYEDVCTFVFSPDGKQLAYSARGQSDVCVVLGDKVVWKSADRIRPPQSLLFSPDSRHLAFVASRSSGPDRVFVDGSEQCSLSPQMMGGIPQLAFSPDGKHLAWLVSRGYRETLQHTLVIDGFEVPGVNPMPGSRLVFASPNELHLNALRGSALTLARVEISDASETESK